MTYGVLTLMAGVKGENGFVPCICPKQDEIDCQQKWEHILQYQRVGIYSVADGRTVAEFLDNNYYLTHNNSLLYFKIVPPVGMFQ